MADDPRLSADEVASRTFATSFRGFDANEVRSFLARVADQLRAAAEREASLTTRLAEAEERASHPEIDEDTLLRLLGDETARVMKSAREAATDLKAHAEEAVEQILREAHDEAKRVRAAADSVLAERTEVAQAEADTLLAAAREEAESVLAKARAEADAVLEEAREQGKAMVVEAQAARERILSDLARRRRIAHVQVEQLRAGRDRLLEAYRMVRSTLDEVTDELQRAEAEARNAADAAARRLADAELPEPEAEPDAPVAHAEPDAPEADVEETPAPAAPSPAVPPAPPAVEMEQEAVAEAEAEGQAGEGDEGEAGVTGGESEAGEGGGRRTVVVTTTVPVEGLTIERPAAPEPPRGGDNVRILAPVAASVVEDAEEKVARAEAVLQEGQARANVEDLFARIRAGREESVAKAREVLAEEPASADPEPETADPQPEAAEVEPPAAEARVSDADEHALQERDAAVADVEARLARKLKRSLQDEQNDVLDRLRSVKGSSFDGVLPALDDHVGRHLAVAVPFLQQVGKGADVETIARDLAESIVGPLRRQLEPALRPSDGDDLSPADRIGMAYREWKGDRIERLASDAVVAAWSRAAYAAVPDGTVLRWVVDDQGAACPDCDDNALAGPTAKGEEYPTGQQHPPAHAGCRCLLVRAT